MGQNIDLGLSILSRIVDDVLSIAEEIEEERMSSLQLLAEPHEQAIAGSGEQS